MQLLTMDLWGHRLYSWIFSESLVDSANWAIENKKASFENIDEFIELVNSQKLEVGYARSLLLQYMQHLSSGKVDAEVHHLKAV